jgi:3-oxo-5-alpha-steroid 4-dehydrogenase 1
MLGSAATDFDMTAAVNRLQALSSPTKLLVGIYAIHYLNRSTIYPLRSPSKRAPMHFMVFLASVVFNVLNGSLLGTWMGGRTLPTTIGNQGAVPQEAFQSPFFWIGVGLWALGFAGNIYHDNILYDLRRPGKDGKQPPRYSIPHGGLYSRPFGGVSLPSYFCEWVEWAGFAIACSCMAPPPALPIFDSSTTAINEKVNLLVAAAKALFFQLVKWMTPFVPVAQKLLDDPSGHPLLQSATYLTPPWLFLINEVAAMVPRGFKSHQWYKQKFGNEFPKDRKAFLPGLL